MYYNNKIEKDKIMTDSNFAHLHVHTNYSTWESTIYIDQLIKKAVEHQMDAVAITDKGTLEGVDAFYQTAIENNIKPIIGCEFFIAPNGIRNKKPGEKRHHLILLAKDHVGFNNLMHLNVVSQTHGFYYQPRIDFELLRDFNEGLIALSGCRRGEIPSLLMANNFYKAKYVAKELNEIFRNDDFYLELQFTGNDQIDQLNEKMLILSSALSIPAVLTNNCHYLEKDDTIAHDILMGIKTGGDDIFNEHRFSYDTDELYFKNTEQMQSACQCPDLLSMTQEISNKCSLELNFG